MAVEIEKFRKTYAGFASALKEANVQTGDSYYQQSDTASGKFASGENFLSEAVVAAVKDGVAQSDLGGMMKHPAVKEAIINFNTANTLLEKKVKDYRAYVLRLEDLSGGLERLLKEIEKDLKTRSKTSESRKDIVALQGTVEKDIKLISTIHTKGDKAVTAFSEMVEGLAKTIQTTLTKPTKMAELSAGKLERHKFLNERILNHSRGKVVTWFKSVQEQCTEISKLLDTDIGKAKEALVAAKSTLDEMKSFVDEYHDVFDRSKKQIEKSAEMDDIYKVRDIMYRGLEAADKLFLTTLRQVKDAAGK